MDDVVAITACPYSGTMHAALTLCALGLDVGHEVYGADGIVSWRHTHKHKTDFAADGFPEDMLLLHQVAHPLMVISRLRQITTGYKHPGTGKHIWETIKDMTKAMDADWRIENELPPLDKRKGLLTWMRLWYHWNKIGIEKADAVFRIEELPVVWGWLLERCGIPYAPQPQEYGKHQLYERTTNRKRTRNIMSWDTLYDQDPDLTLNIIDLAEALGYKQSPVDYLHDEFYNFPVDLRLTLETVYLK